MSMGTANNIHNADNEQQPNNDRPLNSHGFTMCHKVSLPFSQSHGRFLISHGFTNSEQIFSQTQNFLRKQTQAAHSNAAEQRIFNMITKNKTNSRSSLSLSWARFFIMLVKTHIIDKPFQQKPPSDLLKIAKELTAAYNRQHSSQ